jgi:hypothetical protein
MTNSGPEWSGGRQLAARGGKPGDGFILTIPVGDELAYHVRTYLTAGPEYGEVELYYQGERRGTFYGYREEELVQPGPYLTGLVPEEGSLDLEFRISGKDSRAGDVHVGVDALKLEPVREYIPEWYMIGPFPNPRESDILRYGLDRVYPPEKEIDLERTYEGAEGQEVGWTREKTPESGYMSLWSKYRPYEMVIAYALTYVHSPREQTLPLYLGSDDGCKVFLNGRAVHRYLGVRIASPDQDRIPLHLKKGRNALLLKIENNFGGYAFYARIPDPVRSIRFSLNPDE